MEVFSDLHIHSKYSRATSKDICIFNIIKYAKIKGINLIGTGDFTHPLWFKELKENLTEDGSGILKTNEGVDFMLSVEVSNIYKQDNKTRKIHNLILSPSFDIAENINEFLGKYSDLKLDGRPIINIPCYELVEGLKNISKKIEIISCHIWTPWFSLFGSMSGFNSVEECYKDQAKHILALETGLSSDPEMNWRLSSLDKYSLVSFSDAHSFWPWRIGRECCVFNLKDLTYGNVIKTIKEKDKEKFLMTIEFHPEEGKYHFDGHRNCGVCISPKEAIKYNDICPVCRKKLTIGVLHRVEELADRPEGFVPKSIIPFKRVIPLSELIAGLFRTSVSSKKVWDEYNKLINSFKNEFNVLLNVPKQELKEKFNERIAEYIIKNRNGEIKVSPGYDGVYGKSVLNGEDKVKGIPQKRLTEF